MDESKDELLSAYRAGYDSVVNGANTTNCHLRYFRTKELMREWERGRNVAARHLTPRKPA